MYRDDDEEDIPRPENQYQSKETQQKRKAESKGSLLKLERAILRANVGKDKVKADDAQKSEEKKEDAKPAETFGTKTHMQEEKQEVQGLDEKQTNERLIEQQQKQDQAQKQAGEEYQSEPG